MDMTPEEKQRIDEDNAPKTPESFEEVVCALLQMIEKNTKTTSDWISFFGVVSIIGVVLWVIISFLL